MKKEKLLKFIYLFFIISCVVVFYYYIYDGTEYMVSTIDGKSYKVQDGPDMQIRVDSLAILNDKLNTIVNNLKNSNSNSYAVQKLIKNWDRGVTIKEIGKMETDAAYVINKQYMSFCLRDINNNMNLLTYVGIHELSHIMSDEIGHGKEFVKNFEFLLNYAKTLKYQGEPLYIPLNQTKTPDNYCGVSLENSIS